MYFELTLKKDTHICHFKDGSDEKTCTPGVEQKDLFTDEHIREREAVSRQRRRKIKMFLIQCNIQYVGCCGRFV